MIARFSVLLVMLLTLASGLLPGRIAAAEPLYFAYVSGDSNNVECFPFDATTGAVLGTVGTSTVGSPSGYLAWSPDRTKMYGLRSGNQVGAYTIDPTTGALTALGAAVSSGGSGPAHLCVHPTGKWVYVANYSSGHVEAIPVKANGSLDTPQTPVFAGARAHMVLTNRAGTRLYVPCLGDDYIAIYQINLTTGALTAMTPVTVDSIGTRPPALDPAQGWPGPRHMAFNADETRAYVINEIESTMTTFTHNPATGALTGQTAVTTLPTGYSGANTCAHVLVSPDGGTLYGSNRTHDSMVSFRITPSTGQLVVPPTWNTVPGEISHPRDFTLDPSGTVLLCANRFTDTVTVFRVTPSTGVLTRLGVKSVADGPTFVGVMPNRGVLTNLTMTPTSKTLAIGGTQDFDVQGYDQFGTLMAGSPAVTWTTTGLGTITTAGVFTASGHGTATVRATSTVNSSIQATATVTIPNVAPTVATAAAATPSTVTGTTTTMTVLGADDLGEPALKYSWSTVSVPSGGSVTFSASGINAAKSVTATFTKAGSYQISATITDAEGASVPSNTVTVTVNQTFTSLRVTPTNATVTTGNTQAFTAIRRDQFTQDMATPSTATWVVVPPGIGTITTTGVYTAAASAGTETITATDGAQSSSANVTVVAPGGGGGGGGGGGSGGGCGLGGGVGVLALGMWLLLRVGFRQRFRSTTP